MQRWKGRIIVHAHGNMEDPIAMSDEYIVETAGENDLDHARLKVDALWHAAMGKVHLVEGRSLSGDDTNYCNLERID